VWGTLVAAVAVTVVAAPWHAFDRMVSAAEAHRIDRCLAAIPPGVSVSAVDSVLPHLTERREAWPLFVGKATAFTVARRDGHSLGAPICRTRTIVVLRQVGTTHLHERTG
jgi:hypothetical protein